MRKLLAALSRTFYRPRSSINSSSVLQGLPDPEQDEAQKWAFTMGAIPPEGTVVTGLTLNDERANDPEWIAAFCRAYKIRFADAAELEPPKSSTE